MHSQKRPLSKFYLARPLFERFRLVLPIRDAADFTESLRFLLAVEAADALVAVAAAAAVVFVLLCVVEPMRYMPFLKAITRTVILSTEPR